MLMDLYRVILGDYLRHGGPFLDGSPTLCLLAALSVTVEPGSTRALRQSAWATNKAFSLVSQLGTLGPHDYSRDIGSLHQKEFDPVDIALKHNRNYGIT
jgi:hypothetical protein